MTAYSKLLDLIHGGVSPYTNFPAAGWAGAWYGDPGAQREIFKKSIELTKPGIIVEVGSFVGESTIHMAKVVKELKLDAAILCVDTWYGGFDHWVGAREKLRMHFGRPDLYYRFISNVITNGCHDVIVPIAMDSMGGARVIQRLGIVPDFVYLDGSHEEGDVLRDLEAYWALLRPAGGLLADDLSNHFPAVVADWHRFIGTYNLQPALVEGEKTLVIKP